MPIYFLLNNITIQSSNDFLACRSRVAVGAVADLLIRESHVVALGAVLAVVVGAGDLGHAVGHLDHVQLSQPPVGSGWEKTRRG